MGYSTIEVDVKSALHNCLKWEVTEGSDISYFQCNYWRGRVVKAEQRDDDNSYYFTLFNGDFVRVENTIPGRR